MSTDNLDLLVAGAPSAESADLTAGLPPAPTENPVAEPAAPGEIPAPRERQYIPCTGLQITTFLKAVNAGMKDAHYASEGEVNEFVNAKGL